jgi:hypothetical protein
MKLPDAVRRGIRTFFQAATGALLTQWAVLLLRPGELPTWDAAKTIGIAVLTAGVVAVVTYAHNALEDSQIIPTVLKAPASAGHIEPGEKIIEPH